MKILPAVMLAAALLCISTPTAAQGRGRSAAAHPFGLGLMLGTPSGLAGKLYLGDRMAIQAGLGLVREFDEDGLHLHVDAIWHPAILADTRSVTVPFYAGIGGRILEHDGNYIRTSRGEIWVAEDDTHVGARMPVGLLVDFKRVPLDIFVELALVVDFVHLDSSGPYAYHHDLAHLNASIGGRFYF